MHSINRARSLRKRSTPQEVMLWGQLRCRRYRGLKFRRQHTIGNYIVDFVCHEIKLIIEIDGSGHLTQKDYDDERTRYLESEGYKVIRFWNNDVNQNIDGVFIDIDAEVDKLLDA